MLGGPFELRGRDIMAKDFVTRFGEICRDRHAKVAQSDKAHRRHSPLRQAM
jgi:hypothetical protein